MDFYKQLNYSLGNEDWHVEKQALRVNPGDHVVCVTASGDRPLHLLMTECDSIISIDRDSSQNYLLDLKINAIANLDYETWLAFSGCETCDDRYTIFKKFKPHLHPDAARFWDEHKNMIEKGVLYQGRIERLTRLSARLIHLVRHKKIKQLFSFKAIEAQREFVAQHWDTWLWRKLFEVMLNPNISRLILSDPGLNTFTEYTSKPGKYIYQRMLDFLNHRLAITSPLLQLVLLGKLLPEAYFPYLTYEGYLKIRQNINRLTWRNGNIIELLTQENDGTFDCYSLSDIASYMPQAAFEKLLRAISHSAKPMARFCLREFISKRYIPENLQSTFQRDSQLEKKLADEETNFVYRFIVGHVLKNT